MWASRALNRSLAPPDWLSVNLTLRCNLSCVMCTTCYDAPEMTTREVLDLVDQAAAWGVKVFNPLGGEPFVRGDLEDILAHAARRDLHVTVTTNATLITAPRAARIAAIPPEKLHVNISLDGPPAIHDEVRGPGGFKRAIAGYHRLREADAAAGNPRRKICCNAILHRKNVAVFPAFVDFLRDEGFDGVQVLHLFRDREDDSVGGMWFDAFDALERTIAAIRTHPLVMNRPEDLDLVPRYYREGLSPLEAPCWAGWKELYVNSDGSAIMCDGKLDFLAGRYGSVREHTLRELWRLPALTERRAVVKQCRTPCIQNCYLRRESDSLPALVREAAGGLLARVRPREVREVDALLTLELSDIPDTPGDPRLAAFFARSPVSVEALYADPDRLAELRDRGYLDFGRGFMGHDVAARILDAVAEAGIRFSTVALRWRGEPLLHPEFLRVLAMVASRGRVRVETSGLLAGEATLLALREVETWFLPGAPPDRVAGGRIGPAPRRPGLVVSWEGRVTADIDDVTLAHRVGDALKEPFAAIWARAS